MGGAIDKPHPDVSAVPRHGHERGVAVYCH